jgi:hypothetical protein
LKGVQLMVKVIYEEMSAKEKVLETHMGVILDDLVEVHKLIDEVLLENRPNFVIMVFTEPDPEGMHYIIEGKNW